jgi:hypothetical protein
MNLTHGMETRMQTKNGMKPHQAQRVVKWSQLFVTHTMHDMNRKHNCSANYKCCSVVSPIQIVQIKLDSFNKAIGCNN